MSVFDQPIAHDAYEAVVSNGTTQYLLKKSSLGKFRAVTKVSYVQSTSGTNNIFNGTANQLVTFLLPIGMSNELDIAERMMLEVSILNGSGSAALTLLPLHFWINRVEILAGSQLELIYSQNLIEDRLFFSKNDEEIQANSVNENYTYTSAAGLTTSSTTVAASSAATYFLEIPNFLTRAQPLLKSINQQLTVNVYFNALPVTTSSASQLVSVTQCRIYLYGYAFEEAVRAKLLQRYSQLSHYLFYNCPEWTIIPGENLSNVSKSSTRCGVFSGKQMTNLMISVTDNSAVQQNQYNWYPLYQVDEKNSGLSLFSDSLYIDIYKEMAKETFMTSAPNAVNVFLLPHSTDVYRAVNECLQLGSYLYNPNIVLELQAVTNLGSKTVTVTGYSACIFKIQSGAISKMYA